MKIMSNNDKRKFSKSLEGFNKKKSIKNHLFLDPKIKDLFPD